MPPYDSENLEDSMNLFPAVRSRYLYKKVNIWHLFRDVWNAAFIF